MHIHKRIKTWIHNAAILSTVSTALVLPRSTLRAGPMGRPDLEQMKTPLYTIEDGAFVRRNGDRYCNRPLYCNQINGVVLAGDKPYLMLGGANIRSCIFMVGILRQDQLHWAPLCSDITSRFLPGQMDWAVKDASLGETELHLTAVPAALGLGMAIRATVDRALPGDKVVWLSGGALRERETFLNKYDVTTGGREARMKQGFEPQDCAGNEVTAARNHWSIQPPPGKPTRGKTPVITTGQCSAESRVLQVDAADWMKSQQLQIQKDQAKLPICLGTTSVDSHAEIFWSIQTNESGEATPAEAQPNSNPITDFATGIDRAKKIRAQVVVDTPDPWLNAAVTASVHAMDGVYRNGIYTHAGMRWGVPLLGWRTTFGATVYGWHDRVLAQAKTCIARQVTESDKAAAMADPKTQLSSQAPDSRLFGIGRINLYQPYHYDMQSQFFDQLLYAWRSTGDPQMETLLRPALDLHLNYLKACFDPANLGIYESYANTWPTDDQWYNGGGTSEETAYAYRGHHDAIQLARRANDAEKARFHQQSADRIRRSFFDLLWDLKQGHPGAYREQGGLKRLHSSAWLYSIFCPIDAGLLDPFQSAEALDYTEWGLERMKMPYGGEQCWPSNWVPSIWSLREMWPGDNYHLALAYYQTGLPEQGWELLRGTFPQTMFFGSVPGDLGHPAGGTDFNDCAGPFCRTIVEGLFGYSPDYPAHQVKISPGFPADWDHASIKTPDVEMHYLHRLNEFELAVHLTRAADIHLQIPVSTDRVQSVTLNGKPVDFTVLPGFGTSVVQVISDGAPEAKMVVKVENELGRFAASHLQVQAGKTITLVADHGTIIQFKDPQHALDDAHLLDGQLRATPSKNTGHHLVFGLTQVGTTTQWRQFKLHVTDTESEQSAAAEQEIHVTKDSAWNTVNMQPIFNGDIRTIYQQKYVSPRPNTVSLRLASDSYSTWQMVLDPKNKPPDIDLSEVQSHLNSQKQLRSAEGIPFRFATESASLVRNIAFTSQWDNWPKAIDVPVHQSGEAICFLVCGSTNPMEVQIANASLDIHYSDGKIESIDLIPPFNFWSLCPIQKNDYDYKKDFFALPKNPPSQIQLGNNCRAIVLHHRLRTGQEVDHITLNALSQQSIIGLMGVTILSPAN